MVYSNFSKGYAYTSRRKAVDPSSFIAGLCADCRHSRVVPSERSTFYLCERALIDPRYRKYPALPVLSCPGHERRAPDEEPSSGSKSGDKLTR